MEATEKQLTYLQDLIKRAIQFSEGEYETINRYFVQAAADLASTDITIGTASTLIGLLKPPTNYAALVKDACIAVYKSEDNQPLSKYEAALISLPSAREVAKSLVKEWKSKAE